MSQELTLEVAMSLRKGDKLYHNILSFMRDDETSEPATATVLGKAKMTGDVEVFSLPVRRFDGAEVSLSIFSKEVWRTVPEKYIPVPPARIARQRSVPMDSAPAPVTGTTTAKRVTRSRG